MTEQQMIDTVIVHHLIQSIENLSVDEKKEAIKGAIPLVVNEIATSHEWDFSTSSGTDLTVANQASYTFKGTNNNCQSIINIYYNDTVLLKKLEPVAADEFSSNRIITGVGWWSPEGRDGNGYPKVKIIATPTEDGKNLTYRYFKSDITIVDIPDYYDYVIVLGILKTFFPTMKYSFDQSVKKMITSYEQESNDLMIARLDPFCQDRNNDRMRHNGW